ncbi:hypothetical protein FA15DRAFT_710306 [Coprinopsis marcescibilis]|uniref:Ribonuclease H1 N-terminal domain-containing protein n=1 Tax=Coprinopsis marcescibilis TaxID=230819 RepID=A0A5C3KDX9_COPMA|nr:hypothetical protein FA15DRAFT_710306 [Coprinopsis marcescibilis]
MATRSRVLSMSTLCALLTSWGVTIHTVIEEVQEHEANSGKAADVSDGPSSSGNNVLEDWGTSRPPPPSSPAPNPGVNIVNVDADTMRLIVCAMASMGIDLTNEAATDIAEAESKAAAKAEAEEAETNAAAAGPPAVVVVAAPSPGIPLSAPTNTFPGSEAPSPANRWYVVTVGKSVGVYMGWTTVQPMVIGVSGACFQKCKDHDDALNAWQEACAANTVRVV